MSISNFSSESSISQLYRADTVFTDLDGFPNNVHNANEVPDVQDGYGLMISELLGNDSPNCSSLPTNLNSLNNDVGLPNIEVMFSTADPLISL